VKHVSNDAIQDEKRGLIYSSRAKFARTTVPVENKLVNLAPGMAVTVEIKTDKRRVIESEKQCEGTRFLCKKPDSPAPLPAIPRSARD
jgi:hypothetical protein